MGRPYRERFVTKEDVGLYKAQYDGATRDSFVWQLQKPFLKGLVERVTAERGSIRLLDFACGTGRVLGFLEPFVDVAEGVDISPEMVRHAQANCPRAQVRCIDLAQHGELEGDYDIVTLFRFLLNADEDDRKRVLQALHACLESRSGYLITHNHGNSFSLRHPALRLSRRESDLRNELSDHDVRGMLASGGFAVVATYGFGLFPDFVHRSFAGPVVRPIERLLAGRPPFTPFSIDLLYVARPV